MPGLLVRYKKRWKKFFHPFHFMWPYLFSLLHFATPTLFFPSEHMFDQSETDHRARTGVKEFATKKEKRVALAEDRHGLC